MRVTNNSSAATHTVDCVIFGFSAGVLRVLLVRRAVPPFKGSLVLPGGAMRAGDSLEETARKVLHELVDVHDVLLQQVGTYSEPDRHPVRRVVTTAYYSLVEPSHHQPIARAYLREAHWAPLAEVSGLGFDHDRLLREAHLRLKLHLRTRPLAFGLLPARFTLSEAQQLYEEILGEALDRRNFRRKILAYPFIFETNKKRSGVKGGPLMYGIHQPQLQEVLRDGSGEII